MAPSLVPLRGHENQVRALVSEIQSAQRANSLEGPATNRVAAFVIKELENRTCSVCVIFHFYQIVNCLTFSSYRWVRFIQTRLI